jgi:hypothetical protein
VVEQFHDHARQRAAILRNARIDRCSCFGAHDDPPMHIIRPACLDRNEWCFDRNTPADQPGLARIAQ